MSDMPLFENTKFHGAGYDEAIDKARLTGQLSKVFDVMRDGQKRTLREISTMTNAPEASVSAALRSLRNQFNCIVEKERCLSEQGYQRGTIVTVGVTEYCFGINGQIQEIFRYTYEGC